MSECLVLSLGNYSNRSSIVSEEFLKDMHHLKIFAYGIVGAVIIGLGVIGNILNLMILTRPILHGITFTYLSALAVSDLLALLFGSSSLIRLLGIQSRTFLAAMYFSHVELPLVNAFMASSVFIVVCVTVDRYFSICHPTKFKDVHNEYCAKRMIFCAYAIAFLIYIPICFEKCVVVANNDDSNVEYLACENPRIVSHIIYQTYITIKESIVRLGPVVILVFLNISMIISLHLRRRKNSCHSSSFRKKIKDEHRLFRLLASIVVLFFICMTPAAILTLLHTEDKDLNFDFQLFRAIANVLELANYSMNFYVYCFCSPEIRSTFFKICKKNSLPVEI